MVVSASLFFRYIYIYILVGSKQRIEKMFRGRAEHDFPSAVVVVVFVTPTHFQPIFTLKFVAGTTHKNMLDTCLDASFAAARRGP